MHGHGQQENGTAGTKDQGAWVAVCLEATGAEGLNMKPGAPMGAGQQHERPLQELSPMMGAGPEAAISGSHRSGGAWPGCGMAGTR